MLHPTGDKSFAPCGAVDLAGSLTLTHGLRRGLFSYAAAAAGWGCADSSYTGRPAWKYDALASLSAEGRFAVRWLEGMRMLAIGSKNL